MPWRPTTRRWVPFCPEWAQGGRRRAGPAAGLGGRRPPCGDPALLPQPECHALALALTCCRGTGQACAQPLQREAGRAGSRPHACVLTRSDVPFADPSPADPPGEFRDHGKEVRSSVGGRGPCVGLAFCAEQHGCRGPTAEQGQARARLLPVGRLPRFHGVAAGVLTTALC